MTEGYRSNFLNSFPKKEPAFQSFPNEIGTKLSTKKQSFPKLSVRSLKKGIEKKNASYITKKTQLGSYDSFLPHPVVDFRLSIEPCTQCYGFALADRRFEGIEFLPPKLPVRSSHTWALVKERRQEKEFQQRTSHKTRLCKAGRASAQHNEFYATLGRQSETNYGLSTHPWDMGRQSD